MSAGDAPSCADEGGGLADGIALGEAQLRRPVLRREVVHDRARAPRNRPVGLSECGCAPNPEKTFVVYQECPKSP